MSDAEKTERIQKLSSTIHAMQKCVTRLKSKVNQMVEQESIYSRSVLTKNVILEKIEKTKHEEVASTWPENYAQRILWGQQVKAAGCKSAKGMCWHPLMIRQCISLYVSLGGLGGFGCFLLQSRHSSALFPGLLI